jgi:hypothetical protein
MPGKPFRLADLRTVADALYGRRQWQVELARDLNIPPQAIERWFAGKPLPDIRNLLAALCRRNACAKKGGRGKKDANLEETSGFSPKRVQQARSILRHNRAKAKD